MVLHASNIIRHFIPVLLLVQNMLLDSLSRSVGFQSIVQENHFLIQTSFGLIVHIVSICMHMTLFFFISVLYPDECVKFSFLFHLGFIHYPLCLLLI